MQPYGNANQQRASNTYKASSYQGRSETELMAEVVSKVIKQLYMAQEAHTNKNFEAMHNLNVKTLHILDVLREELLTSEAFKDPEAAGPAQFLLSTYTDVIARVGSILSKEAVKEEYDALVEKLTPVYRAWRGAAPAEQAPLENHYVPHSANSVS